MYVILTHDIDYSFSGPELSHILKRRERFSEEIIDKVIEGDFNPYYGIPKIMDIEKKYNVRSTFFFRPFYDNGSKVIEYKKVIVKLLEEDWEIGLHINDSSSIKNILSEKRELEKICKRPILGSRVHQLKIYKNRFINIEQAGLIYDSSLVFDKLKISNKDTNYLFINNLCVFPITFMDAYLFTYMNQTEDTLVEFILEAIKKFKSLKIKFVTLLWHDSSIRMKGGRLYPKILSALKKEKDIEMIRCIDAYNIINESID